MSASSSSVRDFEEGARACDRVARVPLAAAILVCAARNLPLLAEQGDGVGWRGRRRTREDGRDATQVLALQVAARPGDRAAGQKLAPDRGTQRGEELVQGQRLVGRADLDLGVEQAREHGVAQQLAQYAGLQREHAVAQAESRD